MYGKMGENACFINKTRSSAIEIHGSRKRNTPGGLIISILWCMAFISSMHELNRV
jgi:hypothetical protein